jgi:SagB-type dehydrogenase family enzyme
VRINRRELLKLAGGATALLLGAPVSVGARVGAVQIHRETRNTWLGAIGMRGRALLGRGGGEVAKPYSDRRRLALPPADAEDGAPFGVTLRAYSSTSAFREAPLALGDLARLLHHTNGVTGGGGRIALRAAPSAGALYAGELYVVAARIKDLEPGVYYYAVLDHELVQLRTGSYLETVAASVERREAIAGAAAVLLLSNVFARYRVRYANRGYRYALIDTGHIGANFRLAAAARGLGETAQLRFHDDRLNALLGIDGRDEAVCAVYAVGRVAREGPVRAAPARRLTEQGVVASESAEPEADSVVRYHAASKLAPGGSARAGDSARAVSDPGLDPPSIRAGAWVALPRSDPEGTLSVEAAIRVRRSSRQVEMQPISLAEIAYVLEMACGNPHLELAPSTGLMVVANRVIGLDPGLYRYASARHRLERLRGGDLAEPLRQACLGQRKAARAAAAFLVAGNLAAAVARDGEHSYRDLLIEAGAIGERIYLAAEAIRLTARNLAAFLDDRLNGLVGLDGRDHAVLHLTVLGRGD